MPTPYGAIQCLLMPDDTFAITVSQASSQVLPSCAVNSTTKTPLSTRLKRLHSKGFTPSKEYLEGSPDKQGCVSLDWFSDAVTEAAFKGNPHCQNLVREANRTSWRMRAQIAHGIEVDAVKEVQWQDARIESKRARLAFTQAVQGYIAAHGITDPYFYARRTNEIYQVVMGQPCKELKAARGLGKKDSLRDTLTKDELRSLEFAEELYGRTLAVTGNLNEALTRVFELNRS